MKILTVRYLILFILVSCRHQSGKNEIKDKSGQKEKKSVIKPPTIFSDTLQVDSKAAVFYYPDSLQLKKIKNGLDTSVFDAVMHEYAYQFRYAHIVLDKYWPGIKIIEARTARYLLFIKTNKGTHLIDLDTRYDPFGLFVFDPQKAPSQLELTNAESEIGYYFADTGKPDISK